MSDTIQKGIDLLKQHPSDLVNRYIVGYTIRTAYTPLQVLEFNPNFIQDIIEEDDSAGIIIDWEYYFFIASTAEVQFLIKNLHEKYSPKKLAEEASGIIPAIVDGSGNGIEKKIISIQESDELNKHKAFNKNKDDLRN